VCIPPTESIEEKAKKEKKDRRETVAFVAEIVSAAILLLYFGVTILIWSANKKAADIASRQLKLSERAWVGINQPSGTVAGIEYTWSPLLPEPGVFVNTEFDTKNFGSIPALNQSETISIVPIPDHEPLFHL
jgi:hypothetical protein